MTVSNPSPTSAHLRVASSSATRPVAVDVERIERIEVDVDVALVVQLRTPCEEGREGGLVSEGGWVWIRTVEGGGMWKM